MIHPGVLEDWAALGVGARKAGGLPPVAPGPQRKAQHRHARQVGQCEARVARQQRRAGHRDDVVFGQVVALEAGQVDALVPDADVDAVRGRRDLGIQAQVPVQRR